MDALDRSDVVTALQASGGNIGKAAKRLQCSRRTLQNRMRAYGLPRGKAGRRKRRLHYSAPGRAAAYVTGAAALAGLALLVKKRST